MKVGIVGAGSMGHAHAPGWEQTDAEVVGVVSNDQTSAAALAERLDARVYRHYAELLADVDVIDICAPTHLHREMVEEAAAASKHIFCEKPIALTIADGQAMIAACKQAGVRLFVGMVLHFFPEYVRIKQAIQGGSIGSPQVIRLTRASYRPRKAQDNWFMDEEKSGGMAIDLMIHDLEMARWLAGSEVARVYARTLRSQQPTSFEDHGLAILRFENGAMAHVEGSWAYPYPMFSVRAEVAGDDGLIEWDSEETGPIRQHMYQDAGSQAGDVALPTSPLSHDPWSLEVQHFYRALVEEKPFRVTATDALKGLQIALAVRQSAASGQPVQIDAQEVLA